MWIGRRSLGRELCHSGARLLYLLAPASSGASEFSATGREMEREQWKEENAIKEKIRAAVGYMYSLGKRKPRY